MKVYELMAALSHAPAGAEVTANVVISKDELHENATLIDNGLYSIGFNVCGVDYDPENAVLDTEIQ